MLPRVRRLRIGVAGLGRAYEVMSPAFRDPRVALVAAADPREVPFEGRLFSSVEALCRSPDIDLVYVATPHQLHAEHACLAAQHGKHVLVEKPMALTLNECRRMIEAARKAGVQLVVGHSHGFDLPILKAREMIASGRFGRLRMITALNFTDFLYRPRRPEELDSARGGGAVFNQAAHQVDVVRLLFSGPIRSVRAMTGNWDPARPTEGAYSALLAFDDGAFATLAYSGYAHFDSDELMGWVGELGARKDPARYGTARRTLDDRKRHQKREVQVQTHHQHFGFLIASCERADLRPLPDGVMIYGDEERRLEPLPAPGIPRVEVIDELYEAVVNGRKPLHDGEWGMATLEACLAILESGRTGKEVSLGPPPKSA
jgi:phthalate 4,5-cis-dihydrodiol dehydrogenase